MELLNIGYLSTTEQSTPDTIVEQPPITNPTPLFDDKGLQPANNPPPMPQVKPPRSNIISIFKNKK